MLNEHPFFLAHPMLSLIGSIATIIIALLALILLPTAIIRTAINSDLTKTKKILWILGELLISPLTYIYLIAVDKNRILKILSLIVVLGVVGCLVDPDTRSVIMAARGSNTEMAALQQQMDALKTDANLSSAGLCEACTSADPAKVNQCLGHVTLHLTLFKQDIDARRAYCSNQPLTPEIAKEQIAAWCKKVGPNYPFPEPRWKTMYAALAEKYPCPGVSQTSPP